VGLTTLQHGFFYECHPSYDIKFDGSVKFPKLLYMVCFTLYFVASFSLFILIESTLHVL
jgi:hypothetical protein